MLVPAAVTVPLKLCLKVVAVVKSVIVELLRIYGAVPNVASWSNKKPTGGDAGCERLTQNGSSCRRFVQSDGERLSVYDVVWLLVGSVTTYGTLSVAPGRLSA